MTPAAIKGEFRQLLTAMEAAKRKYKGFCDGIAPDYCPRKVGDEIDAKGKRVRITRVFLYPDYRDKPHWRYLCKNILVSGRTGRTTYLVLEDLE